MKTHLSELPAVRLEYEPGDLIVKQGDYGISIYHIVDGKVGIYFKSGSEEVLFDSLGPGEVIGEMIFLQMREGHRTATAVADGPVTLGVLDMELLSKEYRSVSPLLKVLISNLARRLQESTEKLVSLAMER